MYEGEIGREHRNKKEMYEGEIGREDTKEN